ncbi:hypothetical protein Vi05172_g2254 [Venturia inaequalis]|nr:hypothetical protein Vi05172_g2254 [Venturia inaequalis]
MEKEHQIRVIIAGGGITGLVLANALEQAGIDFLLLERRGEISPTIGQSIAAEPNGSRILDQLGILDEWKKHSQAFTWWYERDENGEVLFKTDGIRLGGAARTGYDFLFGTRTKYLDVFYEKLKSKDKVLLNKGIARVDQSENGVTVTCEDGTLYQGDILAGADGVRSKVKEEMWRLARPQFPDVVERDEKILSASYRSLFAIGDRPLGYAPGDCDFGYSHGMSTLVFAGPNNKAYFFIFEKMSQTYYGRDIPRFTKADTEEFVGKYANFCLRPGITVADFWERIENYSFVCLEEGVHELWTFGRVACVGDAVAKMTPNLGAGGNCGIESAAAFANAVVWVRDHSNGERPSQALVEQALRGYQNQREVRAGMMVKSAGEMTRMQAGGSFYHRFAAWIVRLYPGDFVADYLTEYFSGATMLSYLPPPKSSVRGLQSFNPTQGWSKDESRIKRALLALPFLVTFLLALKIMDVTAITPMLSPMIANSTVSWDTGSTPLRQTLFNVKFIDDSWVPINILFTPAIYAFDTLCRLQTTSFLADYGVIIAIWSFESFRRANVLTFATLPTLFLLLGQWRYIGVISPIYYFLTYITSPIENFKTRDMRLGRLNFALVLLPTMVFTYYLPMMVMLFWPSFEGRELGLWIWQMFPIWLALGTRALGSLVRDTTVVDRFEGPERDVPVIRYTIGTLATASSLVWGWTAFRALSTGGLWSLFIPRMLPAHTTALATFTRELLKFDEMFLFGSTFLWLGMLFWDLKFAGMLLRVSWVKLVVYLIGSVLVLGPGATAGLGWLWREEVLVGRKHKDAVVEGDYGSCFVEKM